MTPGSSLASCCLGALLRVVELAIVFGAEEVADGCDGSGVGGKTLMTLDVCGAGFLFSTAAPGVATESWLGGSVAGGVNDGASVVGCWGSAVGALVVSAEVAVVAVCEEAPEVAPTAPRRLKAFGLKARPPVFLSIELMIAVGVEDIAACLARGQPRRLL